MPIKFEEAREEVGEKMPGTKSNAEIAARKIAEAIEPELELHPPLSKSRREKIASVAQSIIATEYEPVMDLLRDLSALPDAAFDVQSPESIRIGLLSIVRHLRSRAQKLVGKDER